jgi:hypothetical protein
MSKAEDLPFELTFHVRDHCLCMHVRRAARALARRYDEALRPPPVVPMASSTAPRHPSWAMSPRCWL